MNEFDKIYQVAIVLNDTRVLLEENKLPGRDLALGENPLVALTNFLEQRFQIKVFDTKVIGVNLKQPGLVTLVFECKLSGSPNGSLVWQPLDSIESRMESVSLKIIEDYKKIAHG